MADITDALIEGNTNCESNSTEDTVDRIEKAEEVNKKEIINVIIDSAGVDVLFPVIVVEETAKEINEFVMEPKIEIDNVCYQTMAKYMETLYTKKEICQAGLGKVKERYVK